MKITRACPPRIRQLDIVKYNQANDLQQHATVVSKGYLLAAVRNFGQSPKGGPSLKLQNQENNLIFTEQLGPKRELLNRMSQEGQYPGQTCASSRGKTGGRVLMVLNRLRIQVVYGPFTPHLCESFIAFTKGVKGVLIITIGELYAKDQRKIKQRNIN